MRIFIDELKKLTKLEQPLQKKINTICTLRLSTALLAIAFFIWASLKANAIYAYLALGCLALFIRFVLQHTKTVSELRRVKCLMKINQKYIDRHSGDWGTFEDLGNEFVDSDHAYSKDLDIFGSNSLFQFICCAHTFFGRKHLAGLLKNPDKSYASINERQGAVRELADQVDFCRDFQCEGILQSDVCDSPEQLITYARSTAKLFKYNGLEGVLRVLTICSLMTIFLLIIEIPIPVYLPTLLLLVQGVITLFGWKCTPILNKIYEMKSNLETYRGLLVLISTQDFKDKHLIQLKKDLFNSETSALVALKKLDNIAESVNVKFMPALYWILNIVLLWDYHCVFELEAWKKQYGKYLDEWLETIGQFEAYISLAVMPQVNNESTFPQFCTDEIKFSAKSLGHPLINKGAMVANDMDMQNNIFIITGSNMSGKTTVLRTVGINLVLAYAGAPVIAKELQCSIMTLFTSMRIEDNLNSGISTFYAELLRIKTIIQYSLLKRPMIFLLDEIFSGTNSKDRIIGAKSVISNLNKKWIIGIVSTHDFELCGLENEDSAKIRNFHFTEYYINDEIRFDYKIKSGRCNSTNAKYLMKLAGIELKE